MRTESILRANPSGYGVDWRRDGRSPAALFCEMQMRFELVKDEGFRKGWASIVRVTPSHGPGGLARSDEHGSPRVLASLGPGGI